MNTFRDKQFKNKLDPKFTYYECIRSCELKSANEKSLNKCVTSCEWLPSYKDPNTKK